MYCIMESQYTCLHERQSRPSFCLKSEIAKQEETERLEADLAAAHSRIEALEASQGHSLDASEGELAAVRREASALRAELAAQAEAREELAQQLAGSGKELQDSREEALRLREVLAALDAEAAGLRERVAYLGRAQEEHAGSKEGLQGVVSQQMSEIDALKVTPLPHAPWLYIVYLLAHANLVIRQ